MKNHLMLDLETMGNKSFSSFVSIGAVFFDMATGETGAEFHIKVDLGSCLEAGLKVDASTIYWWLKQSDAARKGIYEGDKKTLHYALGVLSTWIMENKQWPCQFPFP